jgi:hypothetical protein
VLADEAGQEADDGVPEHRSRSPGEVHGFESLLRSLLGYEADLVEEVARERMPREGKVVFSLFEPPPTLRSRVVHRP